jgi:hypothetical protein
MRCHRVCTGVLTLLSLWVVVPVRSASLPIENASFEGPVVDPNGFPALPMVDGWTEVDLDPVAGTNTGVFANTPAGSADHVANAEGRQLAFLGSEQGNALEQDLVGTYQAGCDYRLTVAVGVSARFPPATEEPVDTIELVLYYRDGADAVDIARQRVEAAGLSSPTRSGAAGTQLQDFSLYLPTVVSGDAWAGKEIGVAIRAAGAPGGFWDLDNVRLVELLPVTITMENPSFEAPVVDPGGFGAVPVVAGWTEVDLDTAASTNTGVFANTPEGSPDHLVNADGGQLAFLGSQQGNALEQDLAATYRVGCDYRLTVAVGVSGRFPPSAEVPADTLELVLYCRAGPNSVDVARWTVEAAGLSSTQLQDFSLYLPTVPPGEAWAGQPIGVAIRAAGAPGGFWDLDNVRLVELMPVAIAVENASFESPAIDPGGFPVLPYLDGWAELDLDTLGSTNTGIFANTPEGSPDRVANADGTQLAFLGSQQGNALTQDLTAVYQVGCGYRLTVAVSISGRFPPSAGESLDSLELVLYYRNGNQLVDIARRTVEAAGLSFTQLQDLSAYLPPVAPGDAWAGRPIGVAIRAAGQAGGFWDLDNVRLAESLPVADLAAVVEK